MNKSINLRKFFLCSLPGVFFCLYFIYSGSFETPYGRQFTLSDTSMVSMTYAKTFVNTGHLVVRGSRESPGIFKFFVHYIFCFHPSV